MKKKYVTPDLKIADFETENSVMDEGDIEASWTDPWADEISGRSRVIMDWHFPNGTELNEDGSPK